MNLALRSAYTLSSILCFAFIIGCSSSGGGEVVNLDCSKTLVPAANSEFCANDAATPDCTLVTGAYPNQVCGVPMRAPTAELQRSANVMEYSGTGPPDISCFVPSSYPAKADPGNSQPVTVTGTAKIFSNGCESKDLSIEIYKVDRSGGDNDGNLGERVGTPVTTPSSCTGGIATPDETCGTVYECTYTYDGVPSETELVVKTSGTFWAPLYDYGVFIANAEVMNGQWTHDVRALASDDYGTISQAAIGGPITATHGAIAGEIHDCGDVRLINAIADIDVDKKVLTYFTNNEDDPLPDTAASASSTLSLYSAIDVRSGPVTVAAAGLVGGQVVTLGFLRAWIFENSVTSVTFRGLRPYQVP